METNKVYSALYAVEQATQLLDMCGRVVQPLHYDILERHAALPREVVSA